MTTDCLLLDAATLVSIVKWDGAKPFVRTSNLLAGDNLHGFARLMDSACS